MKAAGLRAARRAVTPHCHGRRRTRRRGPPGPPGRDSVTRDGTENLKLGLRPRRRARTREPLSASLSHGGPGPGVTPGRRGRRCSGCSLRFKALFNSSSLAAAPAGSLCGPRLRPPRPPRPRPPRRGRGRACGLAHGHMPVSHTAQVPGGRSEFKFKLLARDRDSDSELAAAARRLGRTRRGTRRGTARRDGLKLLPG
jgi:hypothetical protein